MTPYRLRLRLLAPTLSAWHADTLFGSLCWRLVQRDGEAALGALLERCTAGDPPFVFSDGFAAGRLPAPLHPPRARLSGKSAGLQALAAAKRERRLGFLPWDDFAARCAGTWQAGTSGGWTTHLAARNTISRLTYTTGDEAGELYSVAETVSVDGMLDLYLRVSPDYESRLRDLVADLQRSGFGRRAAVGYGAFAVEAWEPFPALDALAGGADAWVSLSSWVPAAGDPVDGWYRLRVKHGRVGEDLAQRLEVGVFKRGLLMIEPGSVFRLREPLRDWYGRLVRGVYDAYPAVAQSGFALAVGMRLGTEGS